MVDSRAQLSYPIKNLMIVMVGIIGILVYEAVMGELQTVESVWELVPVAVVILLAVIVLSVHHDLQPPGDRNG